MDAIDSHAATPLTVPDALRAGMTRKQLRSTKRWRVPFRGIRVAASAPDDLVSRCRALALVLDDGVAFSHVTALRLFGVEIPWTLADDVRMHVVSSRPQDRPQRDSGEVVSHWSRQTYLDTVEVAGLLVTSPAQTLVHVGTGLRLPDDVVVLGDSMMRRQRPLTTPSALADIAGRTHKVKGIVQVREQIERMRPNTDSSTETRARLALVAANLPCPRVNEVVRGHDGRYVKRVDMLYPQYKVAIEYDGDQHRTDPKQWRDDVRRRRMLEAMGWTVIVVVADDLRDPREFVDRVRIAVRRAKGAPRLL